MRDLDFRMLGRKLMQAGIAPGDVQRMLLELRDHVDDLRDEAISSGLNPREAQAEALQRIGDPDTLARTVAGNANLQTWLSRYPVAARFLLPVACYLLLTDSKYLTDGSNASLIVRWSAALTLSAVVTGAMLLAMQLSIVLG